MIPLKLLGVKLDKTSLWGRLHGQQSSHHTGGQTEHFRQRCILHFKECRGPPIQGQEILVLSLLWTVGLKRMDTIVMNLPTYKIAVVLLDYYKSCISCRARVETTKPPLGRYSKCCMMQHMEHCAEQTTAKLIVKEEQG